MSHCDSHTIPELLAPAGGPEPFLAALAAGADAIYCAIGSDFNARRQATNFTYESFAEAASTAHLLGVRVYVTINIVIKQQEMSRALALVKKAWLLGADAFIVQDWGLLREIRRLWPSIECHISTQANVHDSFGVSFAKSFGTTRITTSRELSVQEIETLASTGAEIEGFGHGAICFCYSGICQMSSLLGGRSANRGQCAQPCRLPYTLLDERGRSMSKQGRIKPLCPKDYCTIEDVPKLYAAGLGSLKIEGRMKSADYVFAVVDAYRQAIDAAAAGRSLKKGESELLWRQLSRAFNRGFTNSYLFGTSNDDMMSYDRSNNRGELVGEVVSAKALPSVKRRTGGVNGGRERFKTVGQAAIRIVLHAPVGKGDLLEIRESASSDDFLTATVSADAEAEETIEVTSVRTMPKGSLVRVIRSEAALVASSNALSGHSARKRAIAVHVMAKLGRPLTIGLSCVDAGIEIEVEGQLVEAARTKVLTEDDIVAHVGRMGDTPFEPQSWKIELDESVGMSFSVLHKLRQLACKRLEEAILLPFSEGARKAGLARTPSLEDIEKQIQFEARSQSVQKPEHVLRLCATVSSPDELKVAKAEGADAIYVKDSDFIAYRDEGYSWDKDVVIVLDEVYRELDHVRLESLFSLPNLLCVGNVGELEHARVLGRSAELRNCIPIHNLSAALALGERDARLAWLSPELSLDEMLELAQKSPLDFGVVINARERMMTSEHCVLQTMDACIHDCPKCTLRRQTFYLENIDKLKLPVTTDVYGRSHIYHEKLFDAVPEIPALIEAGITNFMIDGCAIETEQLAALIKRARHVLDACASERETKRLAHASLGHLFSPIA